MGMKEKKQRRRRRIMKFQEERRGGVRLIRYGRIWTEGNAKWTKWVTTTS